MDLSLKRQLLQQLGYSLCADGLGDMSASELHHSWQTEHRGLEHLTLEDAEVAIEAAYDELTAFQRTMSARSKGWEVLKRG